jgi:hypothetical protein
MSRIPNEGAKFLVSKNLASFIIKPEEELLALAI